MKINPSEYFAFYFWALRVTYILLYQFKPLKVRPSANHTMHERIIYTLVSSVEIGVIKPKNLCNTAANSALVAPPCGSNTLPGLAVYPRFGLRSTHEHNRKLPKNQLLSKKGGRCYAHLNHHYNSASRTLRALFVPAPSTSGKFLQAVFTRHDFLLC